jgi:hypothetical protein
MYIRYAYVGFTNEKFSHNARNKQYQNKSMNILHKFSLRVKKGITQPLTNLLVNCIAPSLLIPPVPEDEEYLWSDSPFEQSPVTLYWPGPGPGLSFLFPCLK